MASFLAASWATYQPSRSSDVVIPTSTMDAAVPHVTSGDARPCTYPANTESGSDASNRDMESTRRFSRIASMASFSPSLSGLPSPFVADDKNEATSETSAGVEDAAESATSCTKLENAGLRLAKSVSLATLTRLATARFPPSPSPVSIRIPTRPSNASRPATFDEALALPCLRSHSRAFSMSLFTSGEERAFLHSIMGAPVASRSTLTSWAVEYAGEVVEKDDERWSL
mmetsp:Transcript_38655/g.93078  ORF Transcript_38655/g.93078 Transcript_38655/m.93078 type:complete len:228 (+) Transcript_38655:472-1155(+)